MLKRIITSIVGLPIMILFVVVGGIPLLTGVYVLALIGMKELYNALSVKFTAAHKLALFCMTIYYFLLANFSIPFVWINNFGILIFSLSSIFIITVLIVLVIFHETINIIDCSIVVFGLFYVGFLMSFIYLVRQHNYGQYFVWLIFISAWGCDTAAYFVGTTMGKHKLTPKLSPKKTVEGAIGGVIGAGIIAAIYGATISKIFRIEDMNMVLFCMVAGGAGAIFAQFGDLAASAIKRYTKIKDYGKIFPGHGGVIDRFDSVLFTAPIIYIVMILLLI